MILDVLYLFFVLTRPHLCCREGVPHSQEKLHRFGRRVCCSRRTRCHREETRFELGAQRVAEVSGFQRAKGQEAGLRVKANG